MRRKNNLKVLKHNNEVDAVKEVDQEKDSLIKVNSIPKIDQEENSLSFSKFLVKKFEFLTGVLSLLTGVLSLLNSNKEIMWGLILLALIAVIQGSPIVETEATSLTSLKSLISSVGQNNNFIMYSAESFEASSFVT